MDEAGLAGLPEQRLVLSFEQIEFVVVDVIFFTWVVDSQVFVKGIVFSSVLYCVFVLQSATVARMVTKFALALIQCSTPIVTQPTFAFSSCAEEAIAWRARFSKSDWSVALHQIICHRHHLLIFPYVVSSQTSFNNQCMSSSTTKVFEFNELYKWSPNAYKTKKDPINHF